MAKNNESEAAVTVYELGYLVLPSIAEDKLGSVIDKLRASLAKVGAIELEGEEPFKIDLAYTMTKTIGASRYVVSDAYLGWLKFELDPAKALDLKMEIENIQEILRSLLLKTPRETTFTFAKARAEQALKERGDGQSEEVSGEVSVPSEPVVE